MILVSIILAGVSIYSYKDTLIPKEKSVAYEKVISASVETKTSSSSEEISEPAEVEKKQSKLEEQMSHTEIYNPMTDARLDETSNTDILGNIVLPEVGLDIEFWQGTGYETDSEWSKDPDSDDQRLLKATGMKKNQVLGVDNVVFAAHSAFREGDAGKNLYFSPLLKSKDGSFKENPSVDELIIQIGNIISVYQKSDNKIYKFSISNIFIDTGEDGFQASIDAQGDIKDRPQLTLYVCTDQKATARLVVQAEFIEKK